jgi:hypothetical protein
VGGAQGAFGLNKIVKIFARLPWLQFFTDIVMATKGREVHALEKKIRVMAETLQELGEVPFGSRRDFAAKVGIDYQTLKTAWRSGRLSAALEQKLADAAGFDFSNPTWVDDNVDPAARMTADNQAYPGRDTATAFRTMLRRAHDLPGSGIAIRVLNERPQLIDSNLASFSVEDSGQGSILGEPTPVFFSVAISRGYHPAGIVYGFRRVRLRLVFNETSQGRVQYRLGVHPVIEIGDARVEVRGTDYHPEWFLHVENTVLDGEYSTRDDPLCLLNGLQMDEEFCAELSVRPLDGTLVAVDGTVLPELQKRRIIERLSAKKLPGVQDTQGWLSLGVQRLRIVRADRG